MRWLHLLKFLLVVVLAQQALARLWRLDAVSHEAAILLRDDIEPAALFYTDCPQALRAEKILRKTPRGHQD